MPVLSVEQRNELERVVAEARDVAEAGARAALEALAVHHYEPYSHMSPEDRKLRNRLRARARQLGDQRDEASGSHEIDLLIQECAYEHWHCMLFARFLAENYLLLEPELKVAVSLEECEELAREEGTDLWSLAGRFAQQMLPEIFRLDDPVLQVTFAREFQLKLEELLNGLAPSVFKAGDAIGWVYQFWQTKRKEEVNKSGIKIGAKELPAVTQLFTEPYMVHFLIHNTIGAWYAGKVLAANPELARSAKSEEEIREAVSLPGITWDYLRFVKPGEGRGSWRLAAGIFEDWPRQAAELQILDPCCGSGHFLVSVFQHLVPIRMAEEGLSAKEACDAVLRDNLHGLEIDERCTQIAAFALALVAWTYPGAGGYRPLPELRIACSGIAPHSKRRDWLALAGDDVRLRRSMAELYETFQDAPVLGSLIDPRLALKEGLHEVGISDLRPLLEKAIAAEKDDYERYELGVAARGIADAVQILGGRYHLIITNVPYLTRGKQDDELREFCAQHYDEAKNDIANVFLDRLLRLNSSAGTTALVMPQNWLFLTTYRKFRERMLQTRQWNTLARLGPGAFESISGEVVNVILLIVSASTPSKKHTFAGIDATEPRTAQEKAEILKAAEIKPVVQAEQLENPRSIITLDRLRRGKLLSKHATVNYGSKPGQTDRVIRYFWELGAIDQDYWMLMESTPDVGSLVTGKSKVCLSIKEIQEQSIESFGIRSAHVWGRNGLIISQMRNMPFSLYLGHFFDNNTSVLLPRSREVLLPLYCYLESGEYLSNIRQLNRKLDVAAHTMVEVPFALEYWQTVAQEKYPNGLPEPYSDDPTQWLFHGYPAVSTDPLQVAMARLLGYKWPAEVDESMHLSSEARKFIQLSRELDGYNDNAGIVCIPSVRGEQPAVQRLRTLLAACYGDDWSHPKEQELIAATGSKARDLDRWLRDDFFEQHCKIFHQRPFIWHVWDGRRRDGFHALVNYHNLSGGNCKGRRVLENLTYSYLGDWVTRQQDEVKRGIQGAEDRLAAALELQKLLVDILEGEPPFDIFVRWKPLKEQPIGWEPDINDGVRMNIRPFMASDIPGGRKGAGILRWKPSIRWGKDRGKEPKRPKEQFPWFWEDGEFTGSRVNDVHFTNEEKRKARKAVSLRSR